MADLLTLIIPFVFLTAIVFGALDVASVFKNKRVNAVIAIVFGLFTLTYQPAVDFVMGILPVALIFFVGFFFVGFVIKLARKGVDKDYTLLIIIAALVVLVLATQGTNFIQAYVPGYQDNGNTILTMAGLVFIGVILLAAYRLTKKQ